MDTGGRREETDTKIAAWEYELERLRVALANAPALVNARYHERFVALYRQKEVAKSRWEAIRGVYRPEHDAIRQCDEALAVLGAAFAAADTAAMMAEALAPQAV